LDHDDGGVRHAIILSGVDADILRWARAFSPEPTGLYIEGAESHPTAIIDGDILLYFGMHFIPSFSGGMELWFPPSNDSFRFRN
jgi:hypothetical protein